MTERSTGRGGREEQIKLCELLFRKKKDRRSAGDRQGKAKLVKESNNQINKQTGKATRSSQEELTVRDTRYVPWSADLGLTAFQNFPPKDLVLMTETEEFKLHGFVWSLKTVECLSSGGKQWAAIASSKLCGSHCQITTQGSILTIMV